MKLSNQAVGALLMTLQKCLSEQSDISDLYVTNPPTAKSLVNEE